MNSELYDLVFFNTSIHEWVELTHTKLCDAYGVTFDIEVGDFGFDSYACVITSILRNVTKEDINTLNVHKFRANAHDAWCKNYIAYKQANPGRAVRSPIKAAITHERNDRATTALEHISRDDSKLYDDFIDIVFNILTQKILEAGMQHLNI
jgi:hypothetical protein